MAPSWVMDLVNQYVPGTLVKFVPSKKFCGRAAFKRPGELDMITVQVPVERTDRGVFVVLHEIAHIMFPRKSPRIGRRGVSYHGIEFALCVAALYMKHGVYGEGCKHEYPLIKRFLCDNIHKFTLVALAS